MIYTVVVSSNFGCTYVRVLRYRDTEARSEIEKNITIKELKIGNVFLGNKMLLSKLMLRRSFTSVAESRGVIN